MNCSGADEVIRFIARMIFNHTVQVRNMLEVVSVNLTTSQRGVRQNVILERFNLQIDPVSPESVWPVQGSPRAAR